METQPILSLIVPYRNREAHLNQFLPHMNRFLRAQSINFHIFIIEQADDKPFNRAKLLNIGFKESSNYDYFCFHDVDMLPEKSDYSFVDMPTHLAVEVQQFNYQLAYDSYFGGVTIFSKYDFELINGYSNNYWGWGAEDDDLWNRCRASKIAPKRKPGRYFSLDHERKVDNHLWQENYNYLASQNTQYAILETIKKDGISSLEYEKISSEELTDFATKIKVTI